MTGGSSNAFRSDLYSIYNIVQASMIVYPKEVIIATLRNFFSEDSFYHFSKDNFGFPNTTDHTGLPLGADLPYGPGAVPHFNNHPVLPTRLFIGENYRNDSIFYPAILVKNGGTKYVPISINRNQETIKYEKLLMFDGYGNKTIVNKPVALVTAGAWEGTIIIDVVTRSLRSRDDLIELVGMCLTEVQFETLHQIGVIVKPISVGSPSETNDRNDKLFKQSMTLEIRTEWRREVKIENCIDAILFTVYIASPSGVIDPNLTIVSDLNIIDMLANMECK